jgi:DNA-binding MarR family transcriptional regulator
MGVPRRGDAKAARGGSYAASAAFLLSKVGFESAQRFRARMAPLGLEPRQFALMRIVASDEGQTQQALGDTLGIPKSRMVALIDGLESRGLIERRLRPDDRRARALYLTDDGCDLLELAVKVADAHEAELRDRLTPDEYVQFVSVLKRLTSEGDLPAEVHPAIRE